MPTAAGASWHPCHEGGPVAFTSGAGRTAGAAQRAGHGLPHFSHRWSSSRRRDVGPAPGITCRSCQSRSFAQAVYRATSLTGGRSGPLGQLGGLAGERAEGRPPNDVGRPSPWKRASSRPLSPSCRRLPSPWPAPSPASSLPPGTHAHKQSRLRGLGVCVGRRGRRGPRGSPI